MTRDGIIALFERRDRAWKARDPAALAGTHAARGVVISPTGGVLEGRDDIERIYRLWFSAFPDLVFAPEDLLIDGHRVVQICHVTGTHQGDFFGVAATHRKVEVNGAFLMSLEDGLIVHERRIFDFTGLLVQVGVIRAKPAG